MTIEKDLFARATPDFTQLIAYGFLRVGDDYQLSKAFFNGDFRADISISQHGEVSARVIEVSTDSEYDNLHIYAQKGAFVNSVREAYRQLLTDILDYGFIKRRFFSDQANRLSAQIAEKWNETPDAPFKKYPQTGVFRNPDNQKWYALITTVSQGKFEPNLDKDNSEKRIEIINVKADSERIADLVQRDGIYPAYHMNKKHWITIALDERVSDARLFALISHSRELIS